MVPESYARHGYVVGDTLRMKFEETEFKELFWTYVIRDYNADANQPGSDIPPITEIQHHQAEWHSQGLNCTIVRFLDKTYGKMPG